jgi:hypothetical protein
MQAHRFLAVVGLLSLAACSAAAPTGTPVPVPSPTQAPPSAAPTPPPPTGAPQSPGGSQGPGGPASQAPSQGTFAIRTMPKPAGPNEICAGVGLDAQLHGDPTDARVAWLINRCGPPLQIVWPFGFSARFTPNLEILDADGNVVIREGGAVTGTCDNNADGSVYIIPPFK